MSNYSAGHEAEQYAAKYLKQNDYIIRELNWSTPSCEIDIVAEKNKTVYFVEVKYRKTDDQGRGLDYITPSKLRQMQFAATAWCLENDFDGDYELSAIEMTADYKVTEFIESLT